MGGSWSGGRAVRLLIAAVTILGSSAAMLAYAGHSRGGVATGQASSEVAVIPGFHPPTYPGYIGIPQLPVNSPQVSAYHFTELTGAQITDAALAGYDTVILYGIRWGDLSATAQSAINAFARTGKVMIWDADDTGSQGYETFVHPFSTVASGETHKANDAVVSFPGGNDFLASGDPSSPYYLDPNELVSDRDMLNDMSVMKTDASNWVPALMAANTSIPQGGWALAWTYGDIGNQTGLTIYSGIDADAFAENLSPNYVVKELALQLAAPFSRTPTSSCASNCSPPHGGGEGGSGGGGGAYATCSLQRPVPTRWVHRRVPIVLQTSVASGISATVDASPPDVRGGKPRVLAAAQERKQGVVRLFVNTRWLRSNRVAKPQAFVYVNGQRACSLGFRLKVDNVPPRLLWLRTTTSARGHVVRFKVSESSSMSIVGAGAKHRRWVLIARRRTIQETLPYRVRRVRLIFRDRAGNQLIRKLAWR